MKLSNKLILFILIFLFNSNLSYAASIDKINVIDENNLNFNLSQDVFLPEWKLDSELKVMKDINISFVSKDFEDKNKLILNLTNDLKENQTYSLITILWPEGNFDFETWLIINDFEIQNSIKQEAWKQWINRLIIVNSRTIELYYNNIITEDELEFKLFNELSVNKIEVLNNNVNILLEDKLEKLSNYILMILSIKDNYWNYIKLDEDLYELSTTNNLKISDDKSENIASNEVLPEEKIEEWTIVDVALNSAETPDTWPETTVLIMLTIILNTIFIFRKKFIKK